MAADLFLHVLTEDFTKDHFIATKATALGSKYFKWQLSKKEKKLEKEAMEIMYSDNFPGVFVCEVSWLKATLAEDNETYVPSVAEQIGDLIGDELPVINDDLIEKIKDILENTKNLTQYSIGDKDDIIDFLIDNKGKRVFSISW
jgi:hypothetical protein